MIKEVVKGWPRISHLWGMHRWAFQICGKPCHDRKRVLRYSIFNVSGQNIEVPKAIGSYWHNLIRKKDGGKSTQNVQKCSCKAVLITSDCRVERTENQPLFSIPLRKLWWMCKIWPIYWGTVQNKMFVPLKDIKTMNWSCTVKKDCGESTKLRCEWVHGMQLKPGHSSMYQVQGQIAI